MVPSRRFSLLAAAALLLLCVGANASRSVSSSLQHSLRRNTNSANNLKTLEWFMRRGGEIEDRPAYILIKYDVPPTMHDTFIEKWDRHDKDLRNVKGLDFYQLSKDVTDNTFFWSYTEWDTFADLMDHVDSREYTDFHDWVDDNDILVEMFPLKAMGDAKREYRADREGEKAATAARTAAAKDLERRRRSRDIEEWDPRDEPAHTAIRFHVMPSQVDQFLDAIEDVQKRVVKDEDENRFFVVRKFMNMNHHFLVRGAWDSLEGFMDHITSKHFIGLRQFAKENDIEWYVNNFRVLYTNDEY
ncbi:hypothetical protein Vafri_19950 [Volvox africanus]|nr:hypothetical protein Vafri_19950 [Volvox africanus]